MNTTFKTRLCIALLTFAPCSFGWAAVPNLISYQGRVLVNGVAFNGQGEFKFALVDAGTTTTATTSTATANATVTSGFVVGATITSGGAGYLTPPQVTIHGNGSGATATASISNGAVSAISITNAGSGYDSGTTIIITAPPPAQPVTSHVTYWSQDATSANGSEPAGHVTLPVSKGQYSVLLGDTSVAGMSTIGPAVFATTDVRLRVWFNDGVNGFRQLGPDQRISSAAYAIKAGYSDDSGHASQADYATQAGNTPKLGEMAAVGNSGTVSQDGFIVAMGKNTGTGGSVSFSLKITNPSGYNRTFNQAIDQTSGYATINIPAKAGSSYTVTWSGSAGSSLTTTWIPLAP